jgi:hypothetical protein
MEFDALYDRRPDQECETYRRCKVGPDSETPDPEVWGWAMA